ncbi:uncharacterized protein LOC130048125 [Ostrea edulis]|uniref:uncharacterized protein LOC130048125 n=1 Tax=Ostrea edulis TaxID=37623 RepID=UPI0024AEABD9|nr:uncharacterized protein LOC130048125 [Ostrea edulis]
MVRDTSVKMSWSTGEKPTPAMMGSDSKKGNTVGQHPKKTRGNATLKSKPGRITESGSHMSNYQASSPKSKAQASPAVGPLTPGIYNPGVTSAFTFSLFELPREHKDKNDTMKKKTTVIKKKSKKAKC